jgi:3-hydroxyisobutyrate dehydrogenase
MKRVAVIGLGTMGLPMARNLLAAGHEVVGVDIDPRRGAELGAETAAVPAEAAAATEVALLSLSAPTAVEEVVLGVEGLRAGAQPGFTVVDMSTGPPALARKLAEDLAQAGMASLDAPVSGGPRGAEAAKLTIMVGGDAEVFESQRPLLSVLGSMVMHVGPSGTGQAVKLCNNLMAGATMVAVAEAAATAVREGIDPAVFYDLVTRSTGDSRVLRTRFPVAGASAEHPASNDWEPLFSLDLMAKDLDLVLELAAAHGVDASVAAKSRERYREAQEQGAGGLDYSAVYTVLDR